MQMAFRRDTTKRATIICIKTEGIAKRGNQVRWGTTDERKAETREPGTPYSGGGGRGESHRWPKSLFRTTGFFFD